MKVMEETKNLVKSNAEGIGVGSRRSISNVVHGSPVSLRRLPRRANNLWLWSRHAQRQMAGLAHLIFPVLPVKPHPLPSRGDKWFLGDGK